VQLQSAFKKSLSQNIRHIRMSMKTESQSLHSSVNSDPPVLHFPAFDIFLVLPFSSPAFSVTPLQLSEAVSWCRLTTSSLVATTCFKQLCMYVCLSACHTLSAVCQTIWSMGPRPFGQFRPVVLPIDSDVLLQTITSYSVCVHQSRWI